MGEAMTKQTIYGVLAPRELLEQAVAGEEVRPRLEGRNNTCVGCGNWMPYSHPDAHEHEDGCPEEDAAKRRHWVNQLRTLLDAPASDMEGRWGYKYGDPETGDQGDLAWIPAAQPQGDPVACMPIERCYDVRAKMIIAFNETKKSGGDLDDALDAAYKAALRYSPNPMNAEQPAPVRYEQIDEVAKP
ncbi:hypothetical protein FQ186_29125 [Pseudomonas sp. ANT_H14]|uniref:hypothetical protein n=1 Tax=unclassified Pseudomonas TaxID=196821 RepID=UPI0011EF680D|nr:MULTISPECIES: hypothetical protein [unclassified Pseudomonas]KAA0944856.1 hypothetical protein FQ186_29125 [Pseudomonas sp. ANT_H14]KAA0946361.1 hypothetical protein FQ182_14500 [Pseudomonas sp. ANT_H4]